MNRDLGLGLGTPAVPFVRAPSYEEKRAHRRYQLAVRCWLADGQRTLYAPVHDVSAGGLSLRAPALFAPDAELELSLVLPPTENTRPHGELAIRTRGRVVWVQKPSATSRAHMGARFLDVLDEVLLGRLLGRR